MSELSNLKRLYGVGPTLPTYAGTTKPADLPSTATADQTAEYNKAMDAYNTDQSRFNQYLQDYQNRIASTPISAASDYAISQQPSLPWVRVQNPATANYQRQAQPQGQQTAITPFKFDENYYLQQKQKQLAATLPEWAGVDLASVKAGIAQAGMTPEQHYWQFGAGEGLPPSEGYVNPVENLYQKYLGRSSDAAGLGYWTKQFGEQISPGEEQAFIKGAVPEMQQRGLNLSGQQFIPATGSYWANQLSYPNYINYNYTDPTAAIALADLSSKTSDSTESKTPGIDSDYYLNAAWGATGGSVEELKKKYNAKGYAEGSGDKPVEIRNYGRVQDDGSAPEGDPYAEQQPEEAASDLTPAQEEGVMKMYENYFSDPYAYDVYAARQRSKEENDAFKEMVKKSIAAPDDDSKAELYFRLASAFGQPTRTGSLMENVGLAAKEYGAYKKEKREEGKERLNLQLAAQKLSAASAKEDLDTALKFYQAHQKSGQPLSSAGKTARDMGYTPGTPEYNQKVNEIALLEQQRQLAMIGSSTASAQAATAGVGLREREVAAKEKEVARKDIRLTDEEIRKKDATEKDVNDLEQAYASLKTAYNLSPNAYTSTLADKMARARDEAVALNAKPSQKLYNTRVLEQQLQSQTLKNLRSTFGAQFTEREGEKLEDISGRKAVSREERDKIILLNLRNVKKMLDKKKQILEQLKSGQYGKITPQD